MSSLLNRQLPRFDTADTKQSISLASAISRDFLTEGHGDVVTPIETEEPEETAVEVSQEAIVDVDVPAPEEAPDMIAIAQAELSAQASQLEKAAATFLDATAKIEAEAQTHIKTEIQNLAAQLFPAVGKAFLVDELSKHIPKLVPPMVSSVEVIASPDIAEQLKGRLVMPDGRDTDITLTASVSAAPMQVKLSWKSGGFDYNFDDLMAACLTHAPSDRTMVEE